MGNIENLEHELNVALDTYKEDIKSEISTTQDKNKITADDLEEIARHTFYMMDTFKDAIVKYLSKVNE